jgi:hypothetical protein
MSVIDATALAQNAARLFLEGKPTNSLAERVGASKVVDLGTARARLKAALTTNKSAATSQPLISSCTLAR